MENKIKFVYRSVATYADKDVIFSTQKFSVKEHPIYRNGMRYTVTLVEGKSLDAVDDSFEYDDLETAFDRGWIYRSPEEATADHRRSLLKEKSKLLRKFLNEKAKLTQQLAEVTQSANECEAWLKSLRKQKENA